MKKYSNLMIDLETLGTGANALILSVAAVPFEVGRPMFETGPYFHANIDIQSSLDLGAKIDGDTLTWWLTKKHETLKTCLVDARPLKKVLSELFLYWMKHCDKATTLVWGRGPSFDNKLLADAYRLIGNNQPWEFWNDRCVRTFLDGYEELVKQKVPKTGDAHNPLADCMHQIRCMEFVSRCDYEMSDTRNKKQDTRYATRI